MIVTVGALTGPWWIIGPLIVLVIALPVLRARNGTRLDHDAKTRAQYYVLHGWEARRFVKKLLEEVDVDAAAGTTTYRNPADGSIWIMDYPPGEAHAPRLRRLCD